MDETQPLSHSPLSTPGLKIKNFVHTHKERLNTGVCVCVHVCYSQVHFQATASAARHVP